MGGYKVGLCFNQDYSSASWGLKFHRYDPFNENKPF
ncbi:Uncharacterised protein [Moraxella lacunata]|uniref:Uncharacterized protein n=1 Tax=Moraxella lacunata TaxID=477 RepID=A0A378TA90_MORLA|nr:Uncharacterised protein [Moraxella lacunata]